jgi:hypothetical protein
VFLGIVDLKIKQFLKKIEPLNLEERIEQKNDNKKNKFFILNWFQNKKEKKKRNLFIVSCIIFILLLILIIVLASVLSNKNTQLSGPVSCSIHLFENTSPSHETYSIYGYFWNKNTNYWAACSLNPQCQDKQVDCCYIKRTCDFDKPIETNGCPYYSCECAQFDVDQVINSDGTCGTIPTSTFPQ